VTIQPKLVLQPPMASPSHRPLRRDAQKSTVHRTSKHSGGESTNYISAKYCLRVETGRPNSTRHNWGSTRLVLDLLSDGCEEALK